MVITVIWLKTGMSVHICTPLSQSRVYKFVQFDHEEGVQIYTPASISSAYLKVYKLVNLVDFVQILACKTATILNLHMNLHVVILPLYMVSPQNDKSSRMDQFQRIKFLMH